MLLRLPLRTRIICHNDMSHCLKDVKASNKKMPTIANLSTVFLPTNSQRANSLSLRLLSHHGLMTPQLSAAFGAMEATQISTKQSGQRLMRKSQLVSVDTGEKILHAELSIVFTNLPISLVKKLHETSALFGQLLLDHSIAVNVAEPQLFQTSDKCYGRTTSMTETASGRPICDVTETMSDDALLSNVASRHASRCDRA